MKYSVDDSESLFGRFISLFRNGLAPNYKSSQMQELTWRVRNLGKIGFFGEKKSSVRHDWFDLGNYWFKCQNQNPEMLQKNKHILGRPAKRLS